MMQPHDASAASSADQRDLLKRLLRERLEAQSSGPASSAQRRLWFVNRLEGPSPAYNLPCHVVLRGELDVTLLERSLNELVRRHSTLRTAFQETGGEPSQRIAPVLTVDLPVTDVSAMPREAARSAVRKLIADEAGRPFDLQVAPLFRVQLVRMSAREHVLVFVLHHIISDGWSIGVFVRDLFALYEGLRAGHGAPLPALPISYLGHAMREAEWLKGAECARQIEYWREHLEGLPTLAVPTDRPRPATKQSAGAALVFTLDRGITDALQRICRRREATPFMLLLAAFDVLLARYTGQSDIVVGTPIANRRSVDTEGLVGFFANSLVLRNDLSGDPTFSQLLERVKQSTLEAYANQDVPFERLVEELAPERDASRNALFQVAIALQNEPLSGMATEGLEVGRPVIPGADGGELDVEATTSRFDMELHFWEVDAGLRGVWFYDVALFDAETVAQMSRHLVRLLHGIAENPDRPVSDLPMLSEDERSVLLGAWARNAVPYPRDATVHELFRQQCALSPDAAALDYGGQIHTYAELNTRANRLARHLARMGVSPGARIGICMERGADMITAMLGILKASCAYVPADPEYPPARLNAILTDAEVPVLVTQEAVQHRVSEYAGRVLCIDRDRAAIDREDGGDVTASAGAADLAYIMYTSGSTGEPKGVAVPHRAVVRLVRNADYLQLGPGDWVVQASNASFDAATFEIWGALLNGACVVGAEREQTLVPALYRDFLRERKISVMFITTALFNRIAKTAPDAFRGLRAVLTGGEAADVDCMRRVVCSDGRPERLLHVYGPTESTTFASWFEVEAVADDAVSVPIGRPIANTELYVLDSSMRPVPPGVIGELWIGGDGLARGYWRRPELTDEKFRPDPHAAEPGVLLYRTGDLVRWRRDGVIEFVGRIDSQIKLRGFRIELGEIETRLRECPGVSDAIAIVRDAADGEKQLVVYVVAEQTGMVRPPELKSRLQQQLPAFMVPASIVQLDAWPLTPNGKVDRRRLPEPAAQREAAAQHSVPRTELEKKIAEIWCAVLELPEVGIDDNFFDLGGDSFRLVRVHAALQQLLARDVSVTDLFRHSTVRMLAKHFSADAEDSRGALSDAQDRARKQRAAMALRRKAVEERP